MNRTTKYMKLLTQFIFALALAGVCSTTLAQVDNVTVALQVNSSQTGLDITTHGRCANNNHNGCVEVPKHRKARFQFVLNGNRHCNGGTWDLSGVYLGGKNSPSKPASWGNLDAEVQNDFNVADVSTGLLNHESGSSSQKLVIFDANNHAYEIWYKVTANCVNAHNGSVTGVIETDPRIKNGGSQ